MKLFYQINDPEGDYVIAYEGMNMETIDRMHTQRELTGQLIAEEEYNAFLEAKKEDMSISSPVETVDPDKLILNDQESTTDQRLNALIKILKLN